jgi:cell division protein FtsX
MRPRKRPSLLKAMLAGFFMGALGSIAGFFPITYLHNFLNPYAMHLERGSLLRTLMLGYPLYIGAVFYLPAVGALVGVLTGILAYLRKSRRAWLWGFLAGFLLNLFVSFWAM